MRIFNLYLCIAHVTPMMTSSLFLAMLCACVLMSHAEDPLTTDEAPPTEEASPEGLNVSQYDLSNKTELSRLVSDWSSRFGIASSRSVEDQEAT